MTTQPNEAAAIFLCDESGIMAEEWLAAGYECWMVDLRHAPGERQHGLRVCVGADVRFWTPPPRRWVFAFAFPPCTHLAASGARWWQGKGLRALSEAIDTFGACYDICERTGAPFGVENPVGAISTHFRKPDYTFDPCDYGDPYTKKTCLWTGSGFVMPPKRRVEPTLGSMMHRMSKSDDRARLRSVTPRGFAQAVFAANRPRLEQSA
jgi:hypothetical protein